MPWKASDVVSLREQFLTLAAQGGVPFSELCRRFQISRQTGYVWVGRERAGESLAGRSSRPHSSPGQTQPKIEETILKARLVHPEYGGRKLRRWMINQRWLRDAELPAPSTITEILRRHGAIDPAESAKRVPHKRFEYATPNELWQMDFKGHFATDAGRCHPLTILDDHSRYSLAIVACANEQRDTVKNGLVSAFRTHGLPEAILCDNGPPWGTLGSEERHTVLSVWLSSHGVRVLHGRPFHPQTQGKEERFHRTLKAEVLKERFKDLAACQERFDAWRREYNCERPHEALKLEVPATRYRVSRRSFRESIKPPEYEPGARVRKVDAEGRISVWNRAWKIGKAFTGQHVMIEATTTDGVWNVRHYASVIEQLDRRTAQ